MKRTQMAIKIEFQFVTLSLLTNGAFLLERSLSANYADGGNRNSSIYVTMIVIDCILLPPC